MGDYEGAIADIDYALGIDSQNAMAYAGRAIAKLLMGDDKGALLDFSQAIQIAPNFKIAIDGRKYVIEKQHNAKESVLDNSTVSGLIKTLLTHMATSKLTDLFGGWL